MRVLRLVLLCEFLFAGGQALADTCTLVTEFETGRVLKQEGNCKRRLNPASTFKVPLSLMGYDAGIFTGEDEPAWPYKPEYKTWNEAWKKTTTPRTWLKDSVLWYSLVLTGHLGQERFKRYVDAFDYGNHDVSGDKGKNNGLTRSWLSASSLQISPLEQIDFLSKLLKRELPVSARAQDMTLTIMPAFPLPDGWTAYGKTGTGFQPTRDGAFDRNRQFGWFVGWAQKGERKILFVRLIRDEKKEKGVASFRARDGLLADLPAILEP
ncbi:class D beta-lactamase [Microvirga guangxiensis]|uniref:Beta-lactamase n=1 Tax=Microvirga guangxiensis TaxID=549386 RepID=A0A1G5FBR3_9HYPH|nr:class D beta-lactamase [Microvirga guangxiensis]SCY36088.1 beta-lactamase class D [Microvirga guangxiensis]